MNDYMGALHQRFFREPDVSELEEDIENTRQEVRDCLTEMHELYRRGHTPKVKPTKSCNACSLKEVCLPKLMRTTSVKTYLQKSLEEPL